MNKTKEEQEYTEPLEIKVTRIGKKWHCRLFRLGKIHDETFCEDKSQISHCCRDMLRWYSKMGWSPISKWAEWSRHNNEEGYRQNYTGMAKFANKLPKK